MTGDRTRGERTSARSLVWGALACCLVWASVEVATEIRDRRAIALVDPCERQQSLRGALTALRTICDSPASASVSAHCRSQAEFALRMPECDERCRRTAERFVPQPTR
ncbi:MAG: hypothetical protein JNK05_14175 [Myxococcales bacterium]|nr:hypothetical protein [Myxococcales bacterium]